MFDFENLIVYQKTKNFNKLLRTKILSDSLDRTTYHQLRRSSLSIMLNIAEGSGRFTNPDKRRFFVMARGSLFETVAILQLIFEEQQIERKLYDEFYQSADELSKMLYTLVRKLEK